MYSDELTTNFMNQEHTKKQQMIGVVVSDKMTNTVVVLVEARKRHPKYKKTYTVGRKYKAHNPENIYHTGDRVVIEAIRPMSRTKNFTVIKKV